MSEQDSSLEKDKLFVFKSNLYKQYCMQKEQILEYKWIESEKKGKDIGMEKAWLQWEAKYYRKWKNWVSNYKPYGSNPEKPDNAKTPGSD